MSSKQKEILVVAAILGAGWLALGWPVLPRGSYYPYMGRAGGAGPGQTGSGGRSPGQ